jgi:hypothetical protein
VYEVWAGTVVETPGGFPRRVDVLGLLVTTYAPVAS